MDGLQLSSHFITFFATFFVAQTQPPENLITKLFSTSTTCMALHSLVQSVLTLCPVWHHKTYNYLMWVCNVGCWILPANRWEQTLLHEWLMRGIAQPSLQQHVNYSLGIQSFFIWMRWALQQKLARFIDGFTLGLHITNMENLKWLRTKITFALCFVCD